MMSIDPINLATTDVSEAIKERLKNKRLELVNSGASTDLYEIRQYVEKDRIIDIYDRIRDIDISMLLLLNVESENFTTFFDILNKVYSKGGHEYNCDPMFRFSLDVANVISGFRKRTPFYSGAKPFVEKYRYHLSEETIRLYEDGMNSK